MGMTFTKEQKQVIELRNKNLLVSAAAGSGKTAVLVERILSRITDGPRPADIDELLIVTFTRAAAAEMRERIGAAIEARLTERPEDAHLQRQQTLLCHAQITTIDSFCLFVIRNYFHQIGLEPDFRMGEEGELKLLRRDVLAEALNERYEAEDPDFLRLSETLATGKNDAALEEAVLKLYEFAISDPWPEEWLASCASVYALGREWKSAALQHAPGARAGEKASSAQSVGSLEEFAAQPVYQAMETYVQAVIAEWKRMMEEAIALSLEEDGPQMYADLLGREADQMEALGACRGYGDIYRGLLQVEFGRLPAARGFSGDPGKKSRAQELRNKVKDSRKKLMEQFFSQEPGELAEQLSFCRPVAESLISLTLEFAARFQEKKREKNILDFSDQEHFALKILVDGETKAPTETARQLRDQFVEVMVDEYQDSNYVQEALLAAVAGSDNRFMVGDVKQSIYRFRMARPELFMEKYESYSSDAESGGVNVKIDLHKNFRSRPEVIATVNDICHMVMAKNMGNVEYDEAAALYAGMQFPEGPDQEHFATEILVADPGDFEGEREELEPALIAMKIRELMERQLVTDKASGELRPVRYRDIVILMRGVARHGAAFVSLLQKQGIPALAATNTGYFSATEVQAMLHYLRLLDNVRQDIPMAAALQSPMVGLQPEDLAKIRIAFREMPFYQAVFSYAQGCMGEMAASQYASGARAGENPSCPIREVDENLRDRLRRFLQQLEDFRERVPDTPVHELISQVMQETGYLDYMTAMPGGGVRRANLLMLMEKAIAYEGGSYHGLYHFVRYINELQRYEVDFGQAADEGVEDAVRIMTIHKSKGLEFPVVFLAGMGRAMNQQDVRSRLALHPQYGIGLDAVDLERRVRRPSLIRHIIARQLQMENAGEELRALYVGLTRAREKLILTGTLKKAREKLESYEYRLPDEKGKMGFLERLGASCYFDWALPPLVQKGYRIHQVTPEELTMGELAEAAQQQWGRERLLAEAGHTSQERLRQMDEMMCAIYPYEKERSLKIKLSVSELKHRAIDRLRQEEADGEYMFDDPLTGEDVGLLEKKIAEVDTASHEKELMEHNSEDFTPYVPIFMGREPEENIPALRGTAMHRVLECFDFARDADTLPEQVQEMRERGMLEERLHELISLPSLKQFFGTELARRMQRAARAGKLHKEKPFVMGKPAREVYPETDSDVLVAIQGIIDAFFEEDGEIVIVDYKTDAVKNGRELVSRYQVQMDLYQEAVERATEKKVKEKILYSFRLKEALHA